MTRERRRCPLLALIGHGLLRCTCLLLGVKRTCPLARSPLSRSLSGVKRTWLLAASMSAADPKGTCAGFGAVALRPEVVPISRFILGIGSHARFSNRPVWVRRLQTIHEYGADVARGLVRLFEIGATALPSWGSRTRWNNLYRGLAVRVTAGPSRTYELTSREGQLPSSSDRLIRRRRGRAPMTGNPSSAKRVKQACFAASIKLVS